MAEQPVAWITRQTKDGKQRLEFGHVATNIEYCKVHHEWEWQPLYAAPPAAAVPAESVAWQYRFATPDGLTWSDWQPIPSEAMARQTVDAFGKMGTRAEWRSLNVFEWGGYAGECTDADFADERAQQPAAAVPEVLCTTCGQPTMHMGSMCYGCTQAAMLAAVARKGGES